MMTTRKLRFAIFGNIYQPKKSVSIQKILACLSQHEAEAYIERNFYTFITEGQQLPLTDVKVFDNDQFEADFAISMGFLQFHTLYFHLVALSQPLSPFQILNKELLTKSEYPLAVCQM